MATLKRNMKGASIPLAVAMAASALLAKTAQGQILQSKRGYADTGADYSNTQATGSDWYYTWGPTPNNIGNYNATFYPMIWGQNDMGDVESALGYASTYMLGFNEPDVSTQADLSVSQAITDWTTISSDTNTYNSQHGTSIQLVSPAVSDTSAGESWLESFMSTAKTDGLTVNAVAFHWYDDDTTNGTQAATDFENKVEWYHNEFGLPVFITEFADHDWSGDYTQAAMIAANTQMLSIVIPWLNSQSYVAGYAWYQWFDDSAVYSGSPPEPTTLGYNYDGSLQSGTTEDISGQNLGEHVAFLDGGTMTVTTSVPTIEYINALASTSTVSGTINWGLNSASSTDWVQVQSGATLIKSGTDTITFQNGTMTNNGVLEISQGVLQFSDMSITGNGSIDLTSDGGATGSTAQLELMNGMTISSAITYAQRNDPGESVGIRSVSGNTTLSGLITIAVGGDQTRIESDAGLLTLSGGITTTATSTRNLYFQGAGNGLVSGAITNNSSNSAGNINLFMQGTGTWTLSGSNAFTGSVSNGSGTLICNSATAIPSGSGMSIPNGGTIEFNYPITLNSITDTSSGGTAETIVGPNGSLDVATFTEGTLVNNGGTTITTSASVGNISGTGYLTLGTTSTPVNIQLNPVGGTTKTGVLTLNGTSTIDVTNNQLLIDYGKNPDPVTSILSYLSTGSNGGAWNGTGLISSALAANPSYGLGYADGAAGQTFGLGSGYIEVEPALYGDITMQGEVNAEDFSILANNFGFPTTDGWAAGDFLYQGLVNAEDFILLANNFGLTASGLGTLVSASERDAIIAFANANDLPVPANVPEPASASLLAVASLSLLRRRRRAT